MGVGYHEEIAMSTPVSAAQLLESLILLCEDRVRSGAGDLPVVLEDADGTLFAVTSVDVVS